MKEILQPLDAPQMYGRLTSQWCALPQEDSDWVEQFHFEPHCKFDLHNLFDAQIKRTLPSFPTISTTSFFNSVKSFFISKRNLYISSLSEKSFFCASF